MPAGSFDWSGSVTGKALGLPVIGAIAAIAAATLPPAAGEPPAADEGAGDPAADDAEADDAGPDDAGPDDPAAADVGADDAVAGFDDELELHAAKATAMTAHEPIARI